MIAPCAHNVNNVYNVQNVHFYNISIVRIHFLYKVMVNLGLYGECQDQVEKNRILIHELYIIFDKKTTCNIAGCMNIPKVNLDSILVKQT